MAALEFLNVGKRFGAVPVVDGINLRIGDGEFFTFVGPSGCGKSTLLALVAGLEPPSTGAIRIDGRDVGGLAPRDRDVAMVFQSYALYPHMTVAQNIGFPLSLRGGTRADIDAAVTHTARRLGIDALLARRPRELSGGQRQRVALARALVRRPRVFLMDEPLSNLDARLRLEMRAELKRLHAEHRITTVYVTHDQEEALALSDRVAVLHAGRIQQCGAPMQLHDDPANLFVAGFVGTPPINVFDARLLDDIPDASAPLATGDTLAAIRPADMSVRAASEPSPIVGEVILCEPTGSDLWVLVSWRNQQMMARGHVDEPFARGTKVRLDVAWNRVYFFRRDNGERLRPAVGR